MEIFFIAGTYCCLIFNVVILLNVYNLLKEFQKKIQENFDDLKKINKNIKKSNL